MSAITPIPMAYAALALLCQAAPGGGTPAGGQLLGLQAALAMKTPLTTAPSESSPMNPPISRKLVVGRMR